MNQQSTLQDKLQAEIMSLASTITEIVDKFRQIRHPLAESQEEVPRATQQLDKISEQTEAATHRMLDLVEQIVQRETDVQDGLKSIKAGLSEDQRESGEVVDRLLQMTETTRNDAYTIMDALQFQDITAQQVNHAASVLESLETKLKQVVSAMQGKAAAADEQAGDKRERAFDPKADFSDKRTNQNEIDSIFAQNGK